MNPWPHAGGVVAGVLLAVWFSESIAPPCPPPATILSDAHGAVADLCIQYRRDFNEAAIETLGDLFEGLADDVAIRIVVEERESYDFLLGELSRRGVTRLERLSAVVTGFPITPWARDRFGSLSAGGKPVLAVPPVRSAMDGPRGHDENVPDILAACVPGAACRPMSFRFEGGDLLADEENVFVSAVCLARNQPLDADDRPGLLRRMESELGKRVIAIGDAPEDVPDHHVCMFLTPLGGRRVAVADPTLGLELYRRNPGGSTVEAETADARFRPFHCVAQCLAREGFDVVRIPLLLTRTPRVYVSYNNALLERRGGTGRVFMPVYGIPALDEAARAVFEGQGWRVVPVRVGKLYGHTGSLRCQVGVIARR